MKFLEAIIPSIGVLFLFWLTIRALINADRRERAAQARWEAAADAESSGDEPR
jgi:hypothetical protein